MQIKNYLLITVLFILGTAITTHAQAPCPLDAPTNLVNVTNLPTYKTFTFTPSPGAVSHRVDMTNLSTNITQTFYISGVANSFSANTESGDYLVKLTPCCENNEPSTNNISIVVNDTIIIVDLVGGYQNQCPPAEIKCTHTYLIPLNTYQCTAPGMSETYQFSFNYSGAISNATIYGSITNATNPLQAAIPYYQIQRVYETPSSWVFEEAKSPDNSTGNTAIRIRPQASSTDRLDISADFSNGGVVLKIITNTNGGALFSNFQLYKCGRNTGGRDRDDNGQYEATSEELGTEKALNVLVSPNPFNDNLTLTMEAPQTGNVSVQLYNLTGGLQKSLEITPAELTNNTYTIPTDDLHTGMYIMQVSTEQGVRHTSKVFKL